MTSVPDGLGDLASRPPTRASFVANQERFEFLERQSAGFMPEKLFYIIVVGRRVLNRMLPIRVKKRKPRVPPCQGRPWHAGLWHGTLWHGLLPALFHGQDGHATRCPRYSSRVTGGDGLSRVCGDGCSNGFAVRRPGCSGASASSQDCPTRCRAATPGSTPILNSHLFYSLEHTIVRTVSVSVVVHRGDWPESPSANRWFSSIQKRPARTSVSSTFNSLPSAAPSKPHRGWTPWGSRAGAKSLCRFRSSADGRKDRPSCNGAQA